MILQALYEYYQRKAADPESRIAPEGWEWKEISFLVVIDKNGRLQGIEDTREMISNKKRARKFLVPQGEKRTVGIKSFLLWDNIEYALGANPRKRKDIKIRHSDFVERLKALAENHAGLAEIKTVVKFLAADPIQQIENKKSVAEQWKEMQETNAFITFKISGSKFATVCETLPKESNAKNELQGQGICLLTGKPGNIARLHPSIKGVRGSNTSGASIVSFNLSAFESYGKTQSFNAPISRAATDAYTKALNLLLYKDSQNKLSVADSTIVFWSQKKVRGYDFESNFAWYLTSSKDDPERGIKAVRGLYEALRSGSLPLDEGNRFYVLGLAPNAARISVRFWKTGIIKEFADKIKRHFDDFQIVHGPKEPEYLSLYQILSATALEYKMDNVPPNLSGAVVESALDGSPYPITLLHQCMRRIRAEQQVNRPRAAILKAYINRFNRFHGSKEKEVAMALDRSNVNVGYRLGRLFAVLEKTQEEANPGINANIRERFYGAASATPITVFPQLLKLKNHHLAKLNPGRKVNLEKEMGEIFDTMSEFPTHLTLDEQARFAIGYYHQRQDFFKKKEENS